ncbi:MAG: hypothetical protein ABR555_00300, partial [Pyrinomonadaceae bacterium]
VRYSSQARFKVWWKIFPWEGAGILVTRPGSVSFVGEIFSGSPLSLQFDSSNSQVKWLGKCPWPNGAVSWFELDTQGNKHYFTSETGAFIFGSHQSTRAAFDKAQQSLASYIRQQ